jgi:hypothetical protein
LRKHDVEAFEDRSRPGGGHAVIRVRGLTEVPDGLTFRLRPADGSPARDRPGTWPDGDHRPLSTRLTADGAELLVGPDIVESPELLPGTLAILDIPKCGVRGEFLWPSIQPIARPRRRHVLSRSEREAHLAGDREPAPEPIPFTEASDASSGVEPAAPADASPGPADASADAWATHIAATLAEEARRKSQPTTGPDGSPDPSHPPFAAPAGDGTRAPLAPPRPARPPRHRLAVAAGLALAFLAGTQASRVLSARTPSPPGEVTAASPAARQPARPDPSAAARAAEARLLPLVETATLSPRGLDTAALPPARLLERADVLLNGPPEVRDAAEARFLVRRALARTLGQERIVWALTQLGSLEAEPGRGASPDFAAAAAAWSLAARLGDPIAMCFLAALEAHGLGRPRDAAAARAWYARARDAGGCPGHDAGLEKPAP